LTARAVFALATLVATAAASADTQVVILGTGSPLPAHDRAGAGVAVVYDDRAYLFDVGNGVVQRAIEGSTKLGISALSPVNVEHVFITHLHSDHVLDLVELAHTMWWRRTSRIGVWGPTGLAAMSDGMVAMMATDIEIRSTGTQPVVTPEAYRIIPTEIETGFVFENDGVTIEAFDVAHGAVDPAFGYRVTTPDKTVVISGDTAYSDNLVEMAKGVDVLVHEVISLEGLAPAEENWQQYHSRAHTTTSELARVANEAQPDLLVLYHIIHYAAPIESALTEVQALYEGDVVLASDLDVY